ncbi:hypothetical protein LZ30DRAFT_436110 [Colletotrichum cereale]|nr:hypothetical protein LZ30DRAFT_436110 [Colletotrichum cereale]
MPVATFHYCPYYDERLSAYRRLTRKMFQKNGRGTWTRIVIRRASYRYKTGGRLIWSSTNTQQYWQEGKHLAVGLMGDLPGEDGRSHSFLAFRNLFFFSFLHRERCFAIYWFARVAFFLSTRFFPDGADVEASKLQFLSEVVRLYDVAGGGREQKRAEMLEYLPTRGHLHTLMSSHVRWPKSSSPGVDGRRV